MYQGSGHRFCSRFFSVLTLAAFMLTSSGCATRALMSSDRYEKPAPETQQFRSSEDISKSWQPDSLNLERAYQLAMHQENTLNHQN